MRGQAGAGRGEVCCVSLRPLCVEDFLQALRLNKPVAADVEEARERAGGGGGGG